MNTLGLTTVIIPAFNAEKTLLSCLQALEAQKDAPAFEILLVDNGSTDESFAIGEAFASSSKVDLRIIQEPKPGSYSARNAGMRAARGDVLLFTDSDCCPGPLWLQRLVACLKEFPEVLIAGGEVCAAGDQQALVARHSRAAAILSQTQTLAHPRRPFLQTANLACRRAAAESVGGFDEELYSGGDADFCWRLQAKYPQGRLELVADAPVLHTHRETVRQLYGQFRRYGQSDVMLTRRYGWRAGFSIVKAGGDVVRLVLCPLLSLVRAPQAILSGDLLPVANPWLKAVRILGRRRGQFQAWLRPNRRHRE